MTASSSNANKKMSVAKKVAIGFGALVALLLVAIVVIPLFVDVDHYRPQIVEAVNQKINGKFEMGKLSLSLWGQIRIESAGVKLSDKSGAEVLSVKDAYVHLPFSSVFSGSPKLTIAMKHPKVIVIKNAQGKLNVMSLMKEAPATAGTPAGQTVPTQAASTPAALPALVTAARIGIRFEDIFVLYQDKTNSSKTEVNLSSVTVKDLSLSRPTELEVLGSLDTTFGKLFKMKGPVKLTAEAKPKFEGTKFVHAAVSAKLSLDDMEIEVPETFHKKPGVPAGATLTLTGSETQVDLSSLHLAFHNIEIAGKGNVTHLDTDPVMNVSLKSNEIDFAPWAALLPALQGKGIEGKAHFDLVAKGTSTKPVYEINLGFQGVSAPAPYIKVPPKFSGSVRVVPDRVEPIILSMKAPGSDLQVKGSVISFTKPHIEFSAISNGMDFDQWVDMPPPAAAKAPVDPAKEPAKAAAAPAKEEDYDAMLRPLRENKMAADLVFKLNTQFKSIKAMNTVLSDVTCNMGFQGLGAELSTCKFKVFGGTIASSAGFQFAPKTPTYRFSLNVGHFDIAQAVASQMALFKNTLTGVAHFDLSGTGASFNPKPATVNLMAKGHMKVEQATFATIDIMKMVSDALNGSIAKLGDKIPAAKGKTVGALPGHASKYESVSSDFQISGGKFNAPNFVGKAVANQGIDLKGRTSVGLVDYSLDTAWEVIDTYNMTHARDLSVEQAGVKVDHILADGAAPVKFPVHAGCTVKAPCFTYTEVPEYLGKIALNNVGNALKAKGQAELNKHVESAIQQAPPQVQDALKQLKGKLPGGFF